MSKITTLSQICDALSDGLHKAPVFNPTGEYLFVNATNLEKGYIVDKDEGKRADFSEYQKYGIELNDRTILYSIDGTIGNIARYRGEKVILGKGACYLMVKNGVDPDYIYFLLQSEAFNEYIRKMSTGSTIHHVSLETMRNFKFQLPDYDTQKSISSVLMAIENKIHLNVRLAAELESMAKTIYDYWFTQFDFPDADGKPYRSSGGVMNWNEQLKRKIPIGWSNCKLKDYAVNMTRSTPPGQHLKGLPYTPIDEIPKRQMSFYGGLSYTEANSSLQMYQENDILIGAMRVYFHRVCIAAQKGITRSTTMVLQPQNPSHLAFVYAMFNHDQTIQYATKISVGTQQPYVNWDSALDSMDVILPNASTIAAFCEHLDPVIKKVKCLVKENHELTKLRDWLLPMLMNGQATVK